MATTLTSDTEVTTCTLPFAPGDLVASRYSIVRLVAQGGMGIVYEARNGDTGQRTALKCLRPERAFSEVGRARFRREARLLEHLKHENIVRIAEHGVHDGHTPFIVMEYLDGITLDEFLKVGVRPTVLAALEIAVQVCRAVAFAHALNIVHRDLKPANVMLLRRTGDLTVKLMDFGIGALRSGTQTQLTASGADLGTACYMSPEQARGDHTGGKPSDVYALGLILRELLTGKRVYTGDSYNAILFEILTRPLQPFSEVVPACPPQLAAVLDRCLAPGLEDRYPDAITLLEDLERARSVPLPALSPTPTLVPVTGSAKALPGLRKWMWLSTMAALAGGAAIILRTSTSAEPASAKVAQSNTVYESRGNELTLPESPVVRTAPFEANVASQPSITQRQAPHDTATAIAAPPSSSSPPGQQKIHQPSPRPLPRKESPIVDSAAATSTVAPPAPTLTFQTQNPY